MTVVYIISAPSGSGKSTLVRRVLDADSRLLFSVSYTTRPPRGAERAGENYHFISREEFEARLRRGEFLEWAEVFGHYYGTHRSYWEQALREDRDLVLDIDVQGARQLRREIPDAVSIFILAPSREILEQRLRTRSEDPAEVIERRLREAREEIRSFRDYDYVVVNRELETAAADLAAIIRAERLRRARMEEQILPILASFDA
jgi:guanylate kinase